MTESIARTIILVGATIGAFVWALALRCYLRMRSAPARLTHKRPVRGLEQEHAIKELLKHIPIHYEVTDWTGDGLRVRMPLSTISLRFYSEPGGAVLQTDVDFTRLARLFRILMGLFVLLLEPAVLIGIPALLLELAVASGIPALRWQALQICQIINVLWPPFLIYFVHRSIRGRIETAADRLAQIAGAAQ